MDPILTELDALLQSSAKLCEALKGLSSDINGETKIAINMLIDIFKKVANESASTTDASSNGQSS